MNTIQRIVKNTGALFISQIITFVLAFLYIMYTARYLGAEGFGIISFALAFSGIFQIISDLGLSSLMTREIARDKSIIDKYIRNVSTIKIILSIISLILSILIVYILSYESRVIEVVFLITSYFIFTSFSYMFYSIFQAHEMMEYLSLGQVLNSSLLFLGTILAIYYGFDVLGFALIYSATGVIIFLYTLIICIKKFTLPKIEVDFDFWKVIIKEALPLSIVLIFSTMAFKIDTVLISLIKGSLVVGWYTAAYRLVEVLIVVPAIFTASIYPLFSNYYVNSHESLKIGYTRLLKCLILLGLPIAIGVTLLSNKIIFLMYGSGYSESIIALQILIWSIPFIFLTYTFGTIFISINKQNLLLKLVLISLILNIVLNITIIPFYSYIGSSLMTIFTECFFFFLCFYYLSKLLCNVELTKLVIKPTLASIIMGLFIFYIDVNLFLQITIGTLVYFSALYLLKVFTEEDYDLIKQIINIRRN